MPKGSGKPIGVIRMCFKYKTGYMTEKRGRLWYIHSPWGTKIVHEDEVEEYYRKTQPELFEDD